MKQQLILKGYSLEFHRLYSNKEKEITIQDFIAEKGVPICHRDTYIKVTKGENQNVELYDHLLKKNQIQYDFDKGLYTKTKVLHKEMKEALEYCKLDELEILVNKGKDLLQNHKEIYPHKMEYFVFEQIYNTCVQRDLLDEKGANLLNLLMDFTEKNLQVIIAHILYYDCHRRKCMVSSLRKILNILPVFEKKELLYQNIRIRQMVYEKEYEEALLLVNQFENECIKRSNLARLCEVYQYYMAIYSVLKKPIEFESAKQKLLQLLEKEELPLKARELSEYYLGMCAFTDHHFDEAKIFFERQLLTYKNDSSISMKMFYLSVLSFLHEDNEIFSVQTIDLSKLKSSEKVFLRYFMMKDKKRSNRVLINYILSKIVPILSVDYEMQSAIFLQELYLLKATKEQRQVLEYQLSKSNCVIFQDWVEVFSKL